ncbi:MAG: hypothetical protein IIC51_10540, partial [Planctomycetes bacterium]|nr:hypothetical protein [Planctomycetota bacterium]
MDEILDLATKLGKMMAADARAAAMATARKGLEDSPSDRQLLSDYESQQQKIAGLEAFDEAVGRATEMGRSCLFIPGVQDMNDIQTITGLTILSRVAQVAAEYGAKIEVPTCRSLVMTTAQETVESAFLAAGKPDEYNADDVYYVTDEQFGYVAYLAGMMVREKPAA